MEVGKEIATRLLSLFGLQVEEIPVSDSPRADLRATDGESTYLIEAKDKGEDDALAKNREEQLASGEMYEQSDVLARSNRIKGVFFKARDQLDRTPREGDVAQIIWFHATGIDADLKYRQAFATFYGHVYVTGFGLNHAPTKDCFYFDYNAAFDMPSVDALILSEQKGRDGIIAQLCLNDFAVRSGTLRTSQLFREFSSRDLVVDPVAWEAAGRSISLRSSVSRKHDPEICKALQEQTGTLYTPIRLTRYTASSMVR